MTCRLPALHYNSIPWMGIPCRLCLLLLINLAGTSLIGQSFRALTEWGHQAAAQHNYAEAYHWYNRAHDLSPHATDLYPLLGEAAYHIKNYFECCSWFDRSVENNIALKPVWVMHHIECMIRQKRYESALILIRETYHEAADTAYYRIMETWCNYALEHRDDYASIGVERLGKPYASDENERAPLVHADQLYFFRGDSLVGFNQQKALLNAPVPDHFMIGHESYRLRTLSSGINAQHWFGTACPVNSEPPQNCIIVNWNGAAWEELAAMNQSGSTNIHPYFMATRGSSEYIGMLWFASDREGGFGGFDIWFSNVRMENRFSEPINAGSFINTAMNEWSPYVDGDDILYFASNGHPGYGGYDIYRTDLEYYLYQPPQNLGPEVNSSYDEHYFTGADDSSGYFSSDRPVNPASFSGVCCYNVLSWERLPDQVEEKEPHEPEDAELTDDEHKLLSLIDLHKQRLTACTLLFHNDVPGAKWMQLNHDYSALQQDLTARKPEYLEQNTGSKAEIREIFESAGQSLEQLDSLMASLRFLARQGYKLAVNAQGHASPRWRADYNLLLSQRRLESVKRYIERHHGDLLVHPNLTWKWNHYGEEQSPAEGGVYAEIYTPEALLERRVTVHSTISSSPAKEIDLQ